LAGQEIKVTVRVIVDQGGNVVNAFPADSNLNSIANTEAVAAAKRMKFSPPASGGQVVQKVTVNFVKEGSDFEREARQQQEAQERARQADLDRQRQEQIEQLEAERRERQRQLDLEREERERQLQSN
jgi:TonB family protein